MKIDKGEVKEYVQAFVHAVIFFIILYIFLWPMGIDGGSMQPEFNDRDRVLMSRALAKVSAVDRGDIVICKVNIEGENKDIIKRVIAVGGDHLIINDGSVYLNGEKLTEDHVLSEKTYGDTDILLNDGEYFILGDNREISHDSRHFGPLKKEDISGKVILKWYPFTDIKKY